MLVVTRRKGEAVMIGDDIEVTIVRVAGGTVRLAITAPSDVSIFRTELLETTDEADAGVQKENELELDS